MSLWRPQRYSDIFRSYAFAIEGSHLKNWFIYSLIFIVFNGMLLSLLSYIPNQMQTILIFLAVAGNAWLYNIFQFLAALNFDKIITEGKSLQFSEIKDSLRTKSGHLLVVPFFSVAISFLAIFLIAIGSLTIYFPNSGPVFFGLAFPIMLSVTFVSLVLFLLLPWLIDFYGIVAANTTVKKSDLLISLIKFLINKFPTFLLGRIGVVFVTLIYTIFLSTCFLLGLYLIIWGATYFDIVSGGLPFIDYLFKSFPGGDYILDLWLRLPFTYAPGSAVELSQMSASYRFGGALVGLTILGALALLLAFVIACHSAGMYILYHSVNNQAEKEINS